MRFGSVCSGIEAASVAFAPLGWQAAWLAEIEPFPCALLAHRFPDVPNLGDMTRLAGMVERGEIEAPDLLCGGTPCQSFSVAGLRQSLDDARGNLSLEFIRIADAIDRVRCAVGKQPAYVLWENVPGVLNTRDNAFGAFLGGLCGSDAALDAPEAGWPGAGVVAGPRRVVAWRVLDAQFFGLAQRRKRVFVLARGGAGGWACADALLPVGHSLQGHPAPSRGAREGVAVGIIKGAAIGRQPHNGPQYGDTLDDGSCYTLTTNEAHVGATLRAQDSVTKADTLIAFGWKNSASQGDSVSEHVSPTLDKSKTPAVAFSCKDHGADAGELAPTLRAMGHAGSHANAGGQVAVAFDAYNQTAGPVTHTLRCGSGSSGNAVPQTLAGSAVRRLTPRECERLQGFPDDWTAVPFRGKPAADGPRYKALGNSWAVPCARWIGERIAAVERITAQEIAA